MNTVGFVSFLTSAVYNHAERSQCTRYRVYNNNIHVYYNIVRCEGIMVVKA